MDVTSAESVAEAFRSVCCNWGGIDLVILNAGVAHVAPLSEMNLESFKGWRGSTSRGPFSCLPNRARISEARVQAATL
jgi:NAD(P)-dependent dehydrogenase (short-subunit alcohol dehydrogenase family)